jgi:hypothetical protein
MACRLGARDELVWDEPAALAGVRLEEAQPPSLPVAYRGRPGKIYKWWSSTTGDLVVCGSTRRMRVAMELDFDPDICQFSGEPVELQWRHERHRRRWRPDFVARTAGGRRQVITVRPHKPGPQWGERLAVLEEVAAQADWEVRELRVPRRIRRENLKFAAGYRRPAVLDEGHEHALLAAFAQARRIEDGVKDSKVPYFLGLDHAYRLVWQRRLEIDWTQPLLPTAVAWCATETGA